MQKIDHLSDWQWLKDKPAFLIFKHSNSCPISKRAYQEVIAVEREINLPIYLLVVQEARDLSDYLANRLAVPHASPQILVVKEGKVRAVLSHGEIVASKLLDLCLNEIERK